MSYSRSLRIYYFSCCGSLSFLLRLKTPLHDLDPVRLSSCHSWDTLSHLPIRYSTCVFVSSSARHLPLANSPFENSTASSIGHRRSRSLFWQKQAKGCSDSSQDCFIRFVVPIMRLMVHWLRSPHRLAFGQSGAPKCRANMRPTPSPNMIDMQDR